MFQSNKMNGSISSILGSEVVINGDVAVTGDLLIYGKVFGSINSKGTVNSADSVVNRSFLNSAFFKFSWVGHYLLINMGSSTLFFRQTPLLPRLLLLCI